MKKILTTAIITATILLSLIATLNTSVNAQTAPTAITITGMVNQPTNLTLAELQALPKTTVNAAIICVDAPKTVLENGDWTGVKLSVLLGMAGLQSGVVKIGIFASDGFSSDLPIQTALQDNIILAYEKDGAALDNLRLVVPGSWGYKWVNKVSEIQAVNYDYLGFWESRGYSDSAIVGQDTGLNAPKPFPTPPTSTPSPITTPTPNASTTPTPAPSQNATTGGQATQSPTNQNPIQNSLLPTEALYAVSAGIIIAIAIIALVVHKKVRK